MKSFIKSGIRIKESASITNGSSLKEIISKLKKQETTLEYDIEWQKTILKHIRKRIDYIEMIENNVNTFVPCNRPAFYRFSFGKSSEYKKLTKKWAQFFPIVYFSPLVRYENLSTPSIVECGFCIWEEDVSVVREIDSNFVQYHPSCACIQSVSLVNENTKNSLDVDQPCLDYLNKNNLTLNGDIISVLFSTRSTSQTYSNTYYDYLVTWFPYKK